MVGTAVAAAAMAALTASQAPGLESSSAPGTETVSPPPGPPIDGGSAYYTQLPPLNSPTAPADGSGTAGVGTGSARLPATVLDAYQRAQAAVAAGDPRCHLRWQLLAAIGQVESGQARGGEVDSEGTTITPILGPVLDGNGFAAIPDTDHGSWDGDPVYDRAVGPMQFIPSTWAVWGADGNGDGVRDPDNVYDAALAAAHYLCADGRDLSDPVDLDRAILGYNHSQDYLALVKSWYEHFLNGGAVGVPDSGGAGSNPGPGPGGSAAASGGPGGTGPDASPSPSPSPSEPAPQGPTATAGGTALPTSSGTGTPAGPSPTWTVTPPSLSPTPTATSTTCPTGTASASASATSTATGTASATATATASATATATASSAGTGDPCATASPTASGSGAPSGTASVADSASGALN